MKITHVLCLLLITVVFSHMEALGKEAGVDAASLTNRSCGQLVYCWRPASRDMKVLILQAVLDNGKWRCSDLWNRVMTDVYWRDYMVLPMTVDVSPHEITTYVLYWLSMGDDDQTGCDRLASQLVMWKPDTQAKRSVSIRQYLNAESYTLRKVRKLSERLLHVKSSERRELLDDLNDTVSGDNEVSNILNRMVSSGDFYGVTCLYIRYKKYIKSVTQNIKGGERVYQKLTAQWETPLLEAYNQARESGSPYTAEFVKLFPDSRRALMQPTAVSINDVYRFCGDSYVGFEDTRRLSSFTDFELWGRGMLQVLKTLPGKCDAAVDFCQEYEDALNRYKSNKEQFGR